VNKISIIIPCLNEEKYIANCIESILVSDIDREKTEVIFVDGMSDDKTRDIIQSYMQEYTCIKLLINSKKITPISMNIGINAALGEYIFILSAHAEYEKTYFKELVSYIEDLQANCIGGLLYTDVKNKNKKSHSIKDVLTHRFGVGNTSFRTGSSEIKEVDTVAFGCYKKSTFKTYGMFDERLIRNLDIELNKRIINGGGKIYLIPDVGCTYYARENFTDLAKNSYANGYWNILTAYYTKTFRSLSIRHFVPLIFVLSLLIPLLLSFVYMPLYWIALFSLVSYLSLVIIISIKMKNSFNSIGYLITSFLMLHMSYGVGSLMGIFSIMKKYIEGEE
jgi:glycosyltransferase involved in cell wall biosynthesis